MHMGPRSLAPEKCTSFVPSSTFRLGQNSIMQSTIHFKIGWIIKFFKNCLRGGLLHQNPLWVTTWGFYPIPLPSPDDFSIPFHLQKSQQITIHAYELSQIIFPTPCFIWWVVKTNCANTAGQKQPLKLGKMVGPLRRFCWKSTPGFISCYRQPIYVQDADGKVSSIG